MGTEIGVQDVAPSSVFPGEHLEALPDTVIVFPNFRKERSAAAITHVDGSLLMSAGNNIAWVLGRPHLPTDQWRRETMCEINDIAADAFTLEASTFDYKDAFRVLDGIYAARWETSNLTLCPFGSKLQAVAISLFCTQHSDVRVLFATPRQYNTNLWSDGCRNLWKIDFGSSQELVAKLRAVGTIRVEDLNP